MNKIRQGDYPMATMSSARFRFLYRRRKQACGRDSSDLQTAVGDVPAFPCKYSVTREACGALTHHA
jgi:hypothetical protein